MTHSKFHVTNLKQSNESKPSVRHRPAQLHNSPALFLARWRGGNRNTGKWILSRSGNCCKMKDRLWFVAQQCEWISVMLPSFILFPLFFFLRLAKQISYFIDHCLAVWPTSWDVFELADGWKKHRQCNEDMASDVITYKKRTLAKVFSARLQCRAFRWSTNPLLTTSSYLSEGSIRTKERM